MKRMPNRELQETVARYSLGDMLVSLRKARLKQCGSLQQSMPAISEKNVAAPPDEPLGLLNLGAVKG